MPDELPDDPREWPSDPFAVLGVSRGAPDAEVKSAYVRLIKRFKPEHHPEQFRRIREAYETCRIQARWYRSDDVPVIIRWPAPPSPESEAEESRVESVSDHWKRLIDGPDPEAFAGLLAAAEANPDRADLSLRLYWLLAFHPAFDADRSRHHWLARALRQSRFRGPALDVYRRELEVDPAVALHRPYFDLLTDPPDADLSGIAMMRIAAAGRGGLLERLADDLGALQPHMADAEETWLALLVAAQAWIAWTPTSPPWTTWQRAAQQVEDGLAKLKHLELRHSWSFDRMDEVRALADASRASALPPAVIALVRAAVATNGLPTVAEVEAAAAAVAEDAPRLWQTFDSTVGAVLDVLLRAFETHRHRHCREDTEYPEPLIRAAAERVWRHSAYGYPRWRPHVMQFLLEERLDPREFSAAMFGDTSGVRQGLLNRLTADDSLRVVWLAKRIVEG